jgi:hypothetical protein
MEELTLEEIQGSIRAAFDSVNLINEKILLEKTEDLSDSVDRNYRHLEIMISKEWFADALTESERESIDSAIQSGQNFVNQ